MLAIEGKCLLRENSFSIGRNVLKYWCTKEDKCLCLEKFDLALVGDVDRVPWPVRSRSDNDQCATQQRLGGAGLQSSRARVWEEEEPHKGREPEGTFLPGNPEAEREELSWLHAGDRTALIITATLLPDGQNIYSMSVCRRPPTYDVSRPTDWTTSQSLDMIQSCESWEI